MRPGTRSRLCLAALLLAVPTSLLATPARAQVTWTYGECGTLNPAPRLESHSVDSFVREDPATPGLTLHSASIPGHALVLNREIGQGGIAVDKFAKVLWVTNGNAPPLAFTRVPTPSPLSPANQGSASSVTVGGVYPFRFGEIDYPVNGVDIEYWENPVTGREEAYRMWVAATAPDGSASFLSFWWMTSHVPQGETSGHWYAGSPGSYPTARALDWPVRDIAFGIVHFFEEGESNPGPPTPCLFALGLDLVFGTRTVDVYDLSPLPQGPPAFRYTSFTFFINGGDHFGITIDTSMPQEWGPSNPSQYPQNPDVPRQISGRVLVLGEVEQGVWHIRDINVPRGAPLAYHEWPAGPICGDGNAYVAGLAYSAEIVSLGAPSGTSCRRGLAAIPSDVLADVALRASVPGQPLVEAACPLYAAPLSPSCANDGSPTAFELEAGGAALGPASGKYTPYLLVQKNGVSPVTIHGRSLLVDPHGPHTIVLPGSIRTNPWPPRVVEPSGFDGSVHPALEVPQARPQLGGMPPVPGSTTEQPQWHTYFAQWIFVCGAGVPFPNDLAQATFFASEPFRLAVSNPH